MTADARPSLVPLQLTVDRECRLAGPPRAARRPQGGIDHRQPQIPGGETVWPLDRQTAQTQTLFLPSTGRRHLLSARFRQPGRTVCRRVSGETPEVVDHRRTLDEIDLAFRGTLRPYQEQAVATILDHSFGVLEAGTGSGKTVMALR